MSFEDLLPSVQKLSRTDRVRLMEYLVEDLGPEESMPLKERLYAVWTPFEAYEAAATLLDAIKQDS